MYNELFMQNQIEKEDIIKTLKSFRVLELGVGSSGNASIRINDSFLISPTGLAYDDLSARDIVELDMQGNKISGQYRASSEWRFHKDIYLRRDDVQAIVHVHSPYATAQACTGHGIPAFHYMVAIVGGTSIPCAGYATFGTQELSDNISHAIGDLNACLIANHGILCTGLNIDAALGMALQVEELAKQYILSQMAGGPILLPEDEMQKNLEKFKSYGKQ
jgi:L-fuculose-phosphate aldolase